MKSRTSLLIAFAALILVVNACSSAPPPPQKAAEPPKPAKTETAKKDKPKPPANAPKKEIPAEKRTPFPEDWDVIYDEVKGYEFHVPANSSGDSQTVDGVDVYVGETPDKKVGFMVMAWKDKKLTQDDLFEAAENVLKNLGETMTKGEIKSVVDDYGLAEGTTVSKEGVKSKVKILVATDVTDNYIMIIGSEEKDFSANEKVIDAIWGSFMMYSGGASGNS